MEKNHSIEYLEKYYLNKAMEEAKSDIVLGLQPPYKRPYTNYGVI